MEKNNVPHDKLVRVKKKVEARKNPSSLRRAVYSGKGNVKRAYRKAASLPKVGYPFRIAFGTLYGPKLLARVEGLEHKVALLEEKVDALEEHQTGGGK